MTTSGGRQPPELPLLGTKLRPPRRRRAIVARPRLTDVGAAGADPALTLVSAPAGFGKTTLVADWFADDRTAWLSLDPGDDDPIRFWTYVVASLSSGSSPISAPRRVRSSRTPARRSRRRWPR